MSQNANALEIIRQRGRGGATLAEAIERIAQHLEETPSVRIRAGIIGLMVKTGPDSTDIDTTMSLFGVMPHLQAVKEEIAYRVTELRRKQDEALEIQTVLERMDKAFSNDATKDTAAAGTAPDAKGETDGAEIATEAAPAETEAIEAPAGHTPDLTDAQ